MIRPVNSRSMGLLLQLFCSEVSLLIRRNATQNTMTAYKALCKYTDGSFGRCFVCREVKYALRVSVYSSKTNEQTNKNFHDGKYIV